MNKLGFLAKFIGFVLLFCTGSIAASVEEQEFHSPLAASVREISGEKVRAADQLAATFLKIYPDYSIRSGAYCESTLWENLPFIPLSNKRHYFEHQSAEPHAIELVVLDSNDVNAFALPADNEDLHTAPQIMVSLGLMRLLRSEDELAFVIAHEMSHIQGDQFFTLPPFVFTASQLAHIRHIQRSWEFEADANASKLITASGLSMSAAIRVLEKLSEAESHGLSHHEQSTMVDGHPFLYERISALLDYQSFATDING